MGLRDRVDGGSGDVARRARERVHRAELATRDGKEAHGEEDGAARRRVRRAEVGVGPPERGQGLAVRDRRGVDAVARGLRLVAPALEVVRGAHEEQPAHHHPRDDERGSRQPPPSPRHRGLDRELEGSVQRLHRFFDLVGPHHAGDAYR